MKPFALLALLLLVLPAAAQAELSRAERRMVQSVEQEQDRTVQLLQRLVDQNSGTLNLEGVAAVGANELNRSRGYGSGIAASTRRHQAGRSGSSAREG